MTSERWQRIEQIYHAALARPQAERIAFLDEACDGDDTLRAEVGSLLASDDEANAFLAESAIRVAARELSDVEERSLVGHQLGSYQLLARLGQGGMGEVYRARDVRLDRIVAIKVLSVHLADDADFRRRFEREARTISQLSHPNICTLYDIGHQNQTGAERAVNYLVLEHIEGETLADRLRRGPLLLDQALRTAIEIGEALVHAHQHGIVHRDLKPGNIMLTAGGAKLLDFGLAKCRVTRSVQGGGPAAPTASIALSGAQTILGTLPYMAPEQLEGIEADARTDLWAFGAVLYEMVTGERAFDGESEPHIISAIVDHDPAPLIARLPTIPPQLDGLVRTCLAKKPADRWATAHDILVQLRGITEHAPERRAAARGPRRASRAAWAAVAIVAALAIGVSTLLRRPHTPAITSAGGKPSIAVLYFENNTGNASLDWLRTGLTDMVVTDLSQSPDVEVLGTDRLYQILSDLHRADDRVVSFDTVQEIARRAAVKTVVLGSYVKAGETIRINLKIQDSSSGRIISTERVEALSEAQLFPAVDDLTRRIKAKFETPERSVAARGVAPPSSTGTGVDRDLADITTSSPDAYRYYADGVNLHERGRDVEATAQLRRAVQIDPGFAMAWAKLSLTENPLGKDDLAASSQNSKRALDLSNRLPARERLYVEAIYYQDQREFGKAIAAFEKVLALDPGHISARQSLAVTFWILERQWEAVDNFEELRRRGVTLSATYSTLSITYQSLGQTDKSIEVMHEFLHRNPDSARGYRTLGEILVDAGKAEDAAEAFAKADALNPGDPEVEAGRRNVALLKDHLADVVAADRKRLQSTEPSKRGRVAFDLAVDLLFRGRTIEAMSLLASASQHYQMAALLLEKGENERALAEAQRSLATEPPTALLYPGGVVAPASLTVIARAQARLGQRSEADEAIAEIMKIAEGMPSHADQRRVHWLNGVIALDRPDTTAALPELTRADAMLPPNQPDRGIPVWFALGSAYLATGKDADAATLFQRIIDSPARIGAPIEFVRSLYFLGQIAERQGDDEKSRAHYRRFVGYWGDGDIDRDRVAEARKKTVS